MSVALVLAGGNLPAHDNVLSLGPFDLVVCADRGVDHAIALGLPVTAAVGDFDSISGEGLQFLEDHQVEVEQSPRSKDFSDLELAIKHGQSLGATSLVISGIEGGRADFSVSNLLVLCNKKYAVMSISAVVGNDKIMVVRDAVDIAGTTGDTCSLVAAAEKTVVTTHGLRYRLLNEQLGFATHRGLSNELLENECRIEVAEGVLLVFQTDYWSY